MLGRPPTALTKSDEVRKLAAKKPNNLLSKVLIGWLLNKMLRRKLRRLNVSERNLVVHDWKRFIKPQDLTAMMKEHGLVSSDLIGIQYKRGDFCVGGKPKIAYIGYATKQKQL